MGDIDLTLVCPSTCEDCNGSLAPVAMAGIPAAGRELLSSPAEKQQKQQWTPNKLQTVHSQHVEGKTVNSKSLGGRIMGDVYNLEKDVNFKNIIE